jgi:hypothetical protein
MPGDVATESARLLVELEEGAIGAGDRALRTAVQFGAEAVRDALIGDAIGAGHNARRAVHLARRAAVWARVFRVARALETVDDAELAAIRGALLGLAASREPVRLTASSPRAKALGRAAAVLAVLGGEA